MALPRTNSLKTVRIKDAPNFRQYVANREALLILGKALFWDQQLGSDEQACASCHYHAGADSRSVNQLDPGLRSVVPLSDQSFSTADFGFGPNHTLTAADFPFHDVAGGRDTNDVASSQGVFNRTFVGFDGAGNDIGTTDLSAGSPGALFNLTVPPTPATLVRNVEPRNTPTVINAVLNHRNFWDSRARNEYNGVNPIGKLDPTARVVQVLSTGVAPSVTIRPKFVRASISNSSGASQVDGPPLSNMEMSFNGRRFADVGRKLLMPSLIPLAHQLVATDDGVLGAYANPAGGGLNVAALSAHFAATGGCVATENAYSCLVRKAFQPRWWNAPGWVVDQNGSVPVLLPTNVPPVRPNQFSVMEYNFSLFLGLAVNEYEKTLIANATPFDAFMEGNDAALTDSARNGLVVFLGQGRCINCHSGPEFTAASLTNVVRFQLLERMIMGDDEVAVYDNGHYNTAVRRTTDDIGLGATIGPRNLPLSNSRLFQLALQRECPTGADACIRDADVPRILARPAEAAILLGRGAALLPPGDSTRTAAEALIADATARLAMSPPQTVGAVCDLARNIMLGCVNPGALDLLSAVTPPPDGLPKRLTGATSLLPDQMSPGTPARLLAPPLTPHERVAVDGAFKTPGLRNIELTAPYFHNGGSLTLQDVVAFYDRGGNFPADNIADLDVDIVPLGLADQDRSDLVTFMLALTDPRVKNESAPFDHPSLNVPNGGTADDRLCIPANGAAGHAATPLGTDLSPFANFVVQTIVSAPFSACNPQ